MKNARRVIAFIGLIAIALLYIVFFVLAFTGSPNAQGMLFTAFAATIIVPVLLYLLQLLAKNRIHYQEYRKKQMEEAEQARKEALKAMEAQNEAAETEETEAAPDPDHRNS